ncbi:MAG TPA: TetR/AcrR family transcriptional regulator [Jatrophihabitantaceae bacterium]|jgi:AcrR family transcriptional regulator|nr:TetR/AcrR family transcriptional regulator [Jatrophihabitantaceae bacterium]
MAAPVKRGRPLDPAVSQAALQATLELLDEHGYAGLRVDDVAREAGIGLGGLYRRWATKSELVKAALLSAATEQHVPATDDPHRDLVEGLLLLNAALAGRGGRFLAMLFSGTEPELAAAIRTTKLVPLRDANRERLRRVIGDQPDVAERADAGVGLLVMHLMADGVPMSRRQIVDHVVPLMTGGGRKARPHRSR